MQSNLNGVHIVICCPPIKRLRDLIHREFFEDIPVDSLISHRINIIIEEYLIQSFENIFEFNDIYKLVIEEIIEFISHYVFIHGIRSIEYLYLDTMIIHCSPLGVKDGCNSNSR